MREGTTQFTSEHNFINFNQGSIQENSYDDSRV